MNVNLEGKVALVTGASVGIGKATAIALAKQGADVAINYKQAHTDAEDTRKQVIALGQKALMVKADVSKVQEVELMFDQINEVFGRIDILVNNAGITRFIPFTDLDSLTDEVWDTIYNVNVKGSFFCAREAIKLMKKQGAGDIVNISSQSGVLAAGSSLPYSISKAGVIHMTRCLAAAFAPAIKVNSVSPGSNENNRWNVGQGDLEEIKAANIERNPLKRIAKPEDIAAAIIYLIKSPFSTGVILPVDGGTALI
jgi:3-oxoacyl-[acyl-carrier protein] reductase